MDAIETDRARVPSRRTRRLTPAGIAQALRLEPLVGVTRGAEILGIPAPNFRRDAVPHLTVVPIEGGKDAFFRSEVELLRDRRADARKPS